MHIMEIRKGVSDLNRLLVTGLALGIETGVCSVCDFDFEWLLRFPNVLIWADEIQVTNKIFDFISLAERMPYWDDRTGKSIKLIFEMAKSEGIIKTFNMTEVLSNETYETIDKMVERDRQQLIQHFPEYIKKGDEENVPGEMFIGERHFCYPNMWTIHAALLLAKKFEGSCLFDQHSLEFCKYKWGLEYAQQGSLLESFVTVFNTYLPELELMQYYGDCIKCEKYESCNDMYLAEVEKNFKKIVKWREYDEVYQMKQVTNDIVKKRNKKGGVIEAKEILAEFQSIEEKLKKRLNSKFPKIKRWSNISTIISIPCTLAGAASGRASLGLAGAGLYGISKASTELIKFLESKYSWVGFVNKDEK
ncbi:MAG: hypothetical protein PHZ03_05860 [Syntrophomonas sp.]|nr:hypothetical protein [Syntrophomonas sp.]